MNWQKKILSIILLILPILLFSHPKLYRFNNISIEQGLSQSVVNCVLQDSYGFMWFGTQDGLNMYDGYTFHRYKRNPTDSISISGNWIYSIAEDTNGNLWIGTRSGLNRFNRKECSFTRFLHDPSNKNTLSDNYIHGVFVDKDNYVWVKTTEVLNCLNIETGEIIKYRYYSDPLNSYSRDRGFPIIQDDDKNIWFGSTDGLNCLNISTKTIKRYDNAKNQEYSISDNFITSLAFDKEKKLWIGTVSGLDVMDMTTGEIVHYKHNEKNENSISNNSIISLCIDQDSNIWVGTEFGLNVFCYKNKIFEQYYYEIDNPMGLSNNTILCLFADQSNNLWIGTEGAGLNKIDLKPQKFSLINKTSSQESINLSNNQISSVFLDDKDQIWMGTYGYGLNIYNRLTHEVTIIKNYGVKGKTIVNNWVHAIYQDSKGLIWIGTRNGVSIYSPDTEEFYSLSEVYKFTKKLEFENNRIYMIIEDSKRNIWIGTDLGLYKINWYTKIVNTYTFKADDNIVNNQNNKVFSVIQDSDGIIWIGTLKGLVKFSSEKGLYTIFRTKVNSTKSINHNTIYALYEDTDRYIWIGTPSGLNRLDKKNNKIIYISEKEGLPNNMIYTIEEDNQGFLWVSTNLGLARINRDNLSVSSFDIKDGVQGYEFNFNASYKSDKGELFFGGQNGVNYFLPEQIYLNSFEPKIQISQIEIYNLENNRSLFSPDDEVIDLSYKDHMFTISFASLDYSNIDKITYKYKMDGLENEWVDIGTRNFVTFSNLPAGEYTFSIKGTNSDGVWNNNEKKLRLIIHPPFWKTNIALSLYIIIVILIVYSYIEYRTKNLRLSNQILREKELASKEIGRQKEELAIKNKNITDSINYAKLIQQALFPEENDFKKILTDSFILFKPRDIVSGDFYWVEERDNRIYIAAVDCTGHGVPGALMSIIGFDIIRSVAPIAKNKSADQILELVQKGLQEAFPKNGNGKDFSDGMDMALCVINKNEKVLDFAGAYNSLYVVRENRIFEFKGTRRSIGGISSKENQLFKHEIIPVQKNDKFYIFTDGFADQFGGTKQKKLKYRKFRHLILNYSDLDFDSQRENMYAQFKKWKGSLEQVDDILLMGFSFDDNLFNQ